jgi:hypothetical protein
MSLKNGSIKGVIGKRRNKYWFKKSVNLICDNFYKMRTLNVLISDLEFNKYGLKDVNLTFSEFIEIVRNDLAKQTLNDCVTLAEKSGIAEMTMEEISHEVKAVRNAKTHS